MEKNVKIGTLILYPFHMTGKRKYIDFYLGTITKIRGNNIYIDFDDETSEILPLFNARIISAKKAKKIREKERKLLEFENKQLDEESESDETKKIKVADSVDIPKYNPEYKEIDRNTDKSTNKEIELEIAKQTARKLTNAAYIN